MLTDLVGMCDAQKIMKGITSEVQPSQITTGDRGKGVCVAYIIVTLYNGQLSFVLAKK